MSIKRNYGNECFGLAWGRIKLSEVALNITTAKLVILGTYSLTSFTLALTVVLVAKLVISGILSLIFFILALYTSFLIASIFSTLLSLLKSTGASANLSTSNLTTLLFKLIKPLGTFFNLSMSNLTSSDFKLAKSAFQQKIMFEILLHFLNLFFLHN